MVWAPPVCTGGGLQTGRYFPPIHSGEGNGGERLEAAPADLQTTIWTLLEAGASQREIERITGIDRKTIRAY